jgi:Glycosyltransferase WbsX
MKIILSGFSAIFFLISLSGCGNMKHTNQKTIDNSPGYDIAVYYFPNYHYDDRRNELRYGTGWSEWELVRTARPRFEHHAQTKIPVWGYTNESDPKVMEMKIETAAYYGIDVFIYDWYYYDDGPFLEKGLENGFMKAQNINKMKFALMWANHDWIDIFPRNFDEPDVPVFYHGAISAETFDKMTDYIIARYFKNPSYWLVDGCPYFSIYELYKFIESMGGKEKAKAALEAFRVKTRKAGFKDLHLNVIAWGLQIPVDEKEIKTPEELINYLPVNSATSYVWVHHAALNNFPETEYSEVQEKYATFCDEYHKKINKPYFYNVTMGWDATPRCGGSGKFENKGYPCTPVIKNNTPENFQNALQAAKEWTDKNNKSIKVITINSWNEWTEGSYLEPERMYGYKYLEAIKNVFK